VQGGSKIQKKGEEGVANKLFLVRGGDKLRGNSQGDISVHDNGIGRETETKESFSWGKKTGCIPPLIHGVSHLACWF